MSTDLLDTLDWGVRLEGRTITYSFYADGTVLDLDEDEDGETQSKTLVGWNDYEKQQARLAFESFARLTQLEFVEVASPDEATLRLALYAFDETSTLGWAVPPGEHISGQPPGFAAFNVGNPLWSREPGGALDKGGYSYITLTHEFGHLLGLAHPHDDGGGSPLMPGVVQDDYHRSGSVGFYELNQGVHTMMSYNDGWPSGPVPKADAEEPFGWATGPMALDIAILQRKYGVNDDPGQANTVYDLLDEPEPGYGYTTIWNPAGGHTIRYQGEKDAIINLQAASLQAEWGGGGWVSFVNGVSGGYTIAHGTEVITAISGDGDDKLFGNALDNVFDAGLGRNTIHGNGGEDVVLYGGSVLDYEFDRGEGAWAVQALDESRTDILHDVRRVEFEEGRLYVEALVDESLAVGALYVGLLDRLPEAEGYGYWTSTVLEGGALADVASQLAQSEEFAGGVGRMNDAEFVAHLYESVLGRSADAEGAAYWLDELQDDTADRGTVALAFMSGDEDSPELRNELLTEVIQFGDLWA